MVTIDTSGSISFSSCGSGFVSLFRGHWPIVLRGVQPTRPFPPWSMLGQLRWEWSPQGTISCVVFTADMTPAHGWSKLEYIWHCCPQTFWYIGGCCVTNWALRCYLYKCWPAWRGYQGFFAAWLDSLATITAPYSSSQGILMCLIGATLVLAITRLTYREPLWLNGP